MAVRPTRSVHGMVTEHAALTIRAGSEADFEAAAEEGLPLVLAADGAGKVRLLGRVEERTSYLLLIEWASVDHHVAFTKTAEFEQFVTLIRPFFASAPFVAHYAERPVPPAAGRITHSFEAWDD